MASNDEYQQRQFWEDKKVSIKWFDYDQAKAIENRMEDAEKDCLKYIGFMRVNFNEQIKILQGN